MKDLSIVNGNIEVSSLQVAEWTGKEHKQIMREIREELEELGNNVDGEIFTPSSYINSQNKVQPCYKMNRDGVMQLALKYDAVVRYKVIQKLNELESQTKQLDVSKLPQELQLFNQLFTSIAKAHFENEKLKDSFTEVKTLLADRTENWREYTNRLIDEIVKSTNGNHLDYARIRNESYALLQKRAGCNLQTRLKNRIQEATRNGETQTRVKKINLLDVIASDKRLQEIYISVVKELKIKLAV